MKFRKSLKYLLMCWWKNKTHCTLFGTVIFFCVRHEELAAAIAAASRGAKSWGVQWGGGNMEGGDVDVLIPPRVKKGIPSHLEPFNNYEIFHFSLLVSFSHFSLTLCTLAIRISASKVDGKSFEFLPLGISAIAWLWVKMDSSIS